MGDIVKHLRIRAQRQTSTGITEPHEHIDWMAADEIDRLREELASAKQAAAAYKAWKFPEDIQVLTVENERLREENERLRASLDRIQDAILYHIEDYRQPNNDALMMWRRDAIESLGISPLRAAILEGGKDDQK